MPRKHDHTPFYFEGFANPNTTPVPDVVFDAFLAILGEAELKALLYIIRRTFGFKKDHDPISFNQFLRGITRRDGRVLDQGCGIRNRTTLSGALKSLEEKGIIESEKGMDERGENLTTIYRLRFKGEIKDQPEKRVVRETYHPGTRIVLPVVRQPYLQETALQQTDISSNGSKAIALKRTASLSSDDAKRAGRDGSASRHDGAALPSRHPTGGSGPGLARVGQVLAGALSPAAMEGAPHRRPEKRRATPGGSLTPGAAQRASESNPGRAGRPSGAAPRHRHRTVAPHILRAVVTEIADEFLDTQSLRSDLSRATRLWQDAGVDEPTMAGKLYEARSITRQSRVNGASRMAYFFAVVEDLLGLRKEASGA